MDDLTIVNLLHHARDGLWPRIAGLWALAVLFSLGLALPWRAAALERFKMKHTYYGNLRGEFVGKGSDFFKQAWWLWLLCWPCAIFIFPLPFIYAIFKAIEWRWWVNGMRMGEGSQQVRFESDLDFADLMGLYWKLIGYDQRFNIADRIEARHGRPPRERVVQDVEVPIGRTEEFLAWFLANVDIEPLWLCPLRLRDEGGWPLYPLSAGHTYVNVGFWSSVPVGPVPGHTNRLIEAKVSELDGHKSLYSDAYYGRDEFDDLYGGETYKTVKKTYDPDSRLLDLYAKAVQRR